MKTFKCIEHAHPAIAAVSAFDVKEVREGIPDLRDRWSNRTNIKHGVLYRLGRVVQVWWNENIPNELWPIPGNREVTWTFEDPELAMDGYRSMRDEWK